MAALKKALVIIAGCLFGLFIAACLAPWWRLLWDALR
jgi:hypothetical protein